MDMPLDHTLAPNERETSFHRIIIPPESLSKALEFRYALLFNAIEPHIQLFSSPFSQHGREFLDQFIGLSNLPISLAQLIQIRLLPFQALLFFEGHPMGYLECSWRTLLLRLLCFDHRFGTCFDGFETAGFAFCYSQRSNKATNGSIRASLSLLLNVN